MHGFSEVHCALTIDTDFNPLGHARRNSVERDAQVGAHVEPGHPGHVQDVTLPVRHCGTKFVINKQF